MEALELELEEVESQIRALVAQRTRGAAQPGVVHADTRLPRRLGAAAQGASQIPGQNVSACVRDLHGEPLLPSPRVGSRCGHHR
ncbi:uncharacterized protein isoform X2 [Danio rerio]